MSSRGNNWAEKSVITVVGFFILFISSSLVVAKTQWKKFISSLNTAASIKLGYTKKFNMKIISLKEFYHHTRMQHKFVRKWENCRRRGRGERQSLINIQTHNTHFIIFLCSHRFIISSYCFSKNYFSLIYFFRYFSLKS